MSTNIWGIIARDAREKANGRIHVFDGFWRLQGNTEGKPGTEGILFRDHVDKLGRPIEMVNLLCAPCPDSKWEADYAKLDSGYWIPMRLCRKCTHYRKRRKGAWYSCCGYKASGNPQREVVNALDHALSNAIDFADSIIGKPKKKE